MHIQRIDAKTMQDVKFYTPKEDYPRLPIGSTVVYGIYLKELQTAAILRDIPRMNRAKVILHYCLN